MQLVPLLLPIAAFCFEAYQLIDLMKRRDDEFVGRFDKPIWAAIILALPVIGAIVWHQHKPNQDSKK